MCTNRCSSPSCHNCHTITNWSKQIQSGLCSQNTLFDSCLVMSMVIDTRRTYTFLLFHKYVWWMSKWRSQSCKCKVIDKAIHRTFHSLHWLLDSMRYLLGQWMLWLPNLRCWVQVDLCWLCTLSRQWFSYWWMQQSMLGNLNSLWFWPAMSW